MKLVITYPLLPVRAVALWISSNRAQQRRRWPPAELVCAFCLTLLMALVAPLIAKAAPEFKICNNQRYALCAVASCFVFDQVAYCKCDVKTGDSISLPYNYSGGDVCTVNAQGPGNGYMVSTFSVPESVLEGGNKALYTCPASTSDGAYAQCDGGICFTSTRGQKFPGFDRRLNNNEIICSCPITSANPSQAFVGHQIVGPLPCQDSFFANCQSAKAHTRTGGTVYVGAPTGSARILARELTGTVHNINHCRAPQ
jgi:hypothetical protein